MGREIKGWEILTSLKEKVEQFRGILPLIQDLKNPAMRPRHWEKLQEEVGKSFSSFQRFTASNNTRP